MKPVTKGNTDGSFISYLITMSLIEHKLTVAGIRMCVYMCKCVCVCEGVHMRVRMSSLGKEHKT